MIHNIVQTIQDDMIILSQWVKREDLDQNDGMDVQYRVQVAASRSLATIGMIFGSLWALSILTFVVSIPAFILLKLCTAVGIYTIGHDIFVMSHNASNQKFQQSTPSRLVGLFRGKEVLEEKKAQKFTNGTFLQPAWMWLYANRPLSP